MTAPKASLAELRVYYDAWFADFDPDGEYRAAVSARMEAERREAEAWQRVQQRHAKERLEPEVYAAIHGVANILRVTLR